MFFHFLMAMNESFHVSFWTRPSAETKLASDYSMEFVKNGGIFSIFNNSFRNIILNLIFWHGFFFWLLTVLNKPHNKRANFSNKRD